MSQPPQYFLTPPPSPKKISTTPGYNLNPSKKISTPPEKISTPPKKSQPLPKKNVNPASRIIPNPTRKNLNPAPQKFDNPSRKNVTSTENI